MARVDQARIAWIAPETVAIDRRRDLVKRHRGDTDSLLEKLDQLERGLTGEYRVLRQPNSDPNLGSATRVEAGVGVEEHEDELAVWIDDAPDDPEDPAGHYEEYDPARHGSPYAPIPSRRGRPTAEAPRVEED